MTVPGVNVQTAATCALDVEAQAVRAGVESDVALGVGAEVNHEPACGRTSIHEHLPQLVEVTATADDVNDRDVVDAGVRAPIRPLGLVSPR